MHTMHNILITKLDPLVELFPEIMNANKKCSLVLSAKSYLGVFVNDVICNWSDGKELGFFHISFAQTLTAHNICLTHFTPSILIYVNALEYILSIKSAFVMRNIDISLLMLLYMGRGSKKYNFQKIEKDK